MGFLLAQACEQGNPGLGGLRDASSLSSVAGFREDSKCWLWVPQSWLTVLFPGWNDSASFLLGYTYNTFL